MAEADRKDFFISYTQGDRLWAEWIAWELEAAGYSTVLQAWDFRPGRNFVLEMDRAAKEASRTIAVLSPDYLSALFTQPEWAAAFAQDPSGEKGLLVPVLVRKVDIEGLLGQIIYIDLVDLNEEAARKALIAGVGPGRGKPSTAPGFPGAKPKKEPPRFPGALPPIWNVPHRQNPNFTGREELLEALRESLAAGQATALTQAALHGLGGVGKTQLALEYAFRHFRDKQDYDIVWWLRAEDPLALAGDYAALAAELDLPEKGAAEQEDQVAAVRRWLSQHDRWLLIFDNAGKPEDLMSYLPQGGGGQVLITSRYAAWRGTARPLDVRVWHRGESVAFILKRTGQQDEAAAVELAQELGDLPLALEQAGAYIDGCRCSISHYLELFRTRRQEILKKGKISPDYPETVATTWEISFRKLQEEAPAAAALLNLCAFLAPDDIPREILEKGAAHLPQDLAAAVKDPLAWDEALAALRRYSLLEVGEDSLAVHRLVQAVVRDRLDEEGQKQWAGAAVETVNAALSADVDTNVKIWPWYSRLLPHALAAAAYGETFEIALPAAGRLLNQAGFYLGIRAEFEAAKNCYAHALAIMEHIKGPNHPHVAITANNLGRVLKDLGDLAGARAHYERALAIDEAAYGPNDPDVAIDVNNLGRLLKDLGDLAGARAHFERALAIWERVHGPNHPLVATAVNNLGLVLQELGDLEGAKEHFERSLAIDEAAYGPNHPDVAIDVNNLGGVLKNLGDLEGARSHLERALAILRQFLGEDHPHTRLVRENLESLD
jgi:tetratricopeptide (TPR) repeat protein